LSGIRNNQKVIQLLWFNAVYKIQLNRIETINILLKLLNMTNRKKSFIIFPFIVLAILIFQSCEENENETLVSANNGTKSHNMGENCMSCHKSGGEGEGWFVVAGTVYNNKFSAVEPNGVVKLYTGVAGTGTLRGTIYVDGNGNFYTTNTIDFTGGLYPTVTGKSGSVSSMDSPVTDGKCNSCHGSSTDKIFVN